MVVYGALRSEITSANSLRYAFLRGRWKGRLRESVPWERNDDWWCLGGLALHCIQPVAHCGEITSVTVSRGFVLHCRTLCVGQRVAKLDRLISLSARYTYTIHLSTESLSKVFFTYLPVINSAPILATGILPCSRAPNTKHNVSPDLRKYKPKTFISKAHSRPPVPGHTGRSVFTLVGFG